MAHLKTYLMVNVCEMLFIFNGHLTILYMLVLISLCVCLQIVSKLKEEIGAMEKEHCELQQHISRTDWWCENLGHWRAVITTAEVRFFILRFLLPHLMINSSHA